MSSTSAAIQEAILEKVSRALAEGVPNEGLLELVAQGLRHQQEAQSRFTGLVIDSLPVGLYVIDADYRIVLWNKMRETGPQALTRDRVLGRRVFDVLTRQPAQLLKAEFDQIFASGKMVQREHEVPNIDGSLRVYRQSRIPMSYDADRVTHVVTFGEDVTARRMSERQAIQSEKLAAVGQLAAGAMHEINNPLATIGACVSAIEARLDGAAQKSVGEYLQIIESEVHRCTRIVDQLLDFSRMAPGSAQRAPFDLNALVEQTLFLLKHHQRFKRLTLERDFAIGLRPVLANQERLVQAFMAILLNAADAMPQGGTLRIRTAGAPEHPGEVLVEFADQGPGIPPHALSRIFEPFFTTKPPGQGTGLGLTICFGIIEEHGGRIAVDSQPGKGTLFRIFLPVGAGPEA